MSSARLGLSATVFLTSTLGWAAIALYVYVYLHWNVVAYVALAPIACRLLGGRILFVLHVAYGLLLITVSMLNYTVTPMKLLGFGDTAAGAAAWLGRAGCPRRGAAGGASGGLPRRHALHLRGPARLRAARHRRRRVQPGAVAERLLVGRRGTCRTRCDHRRRPATITIDEARDRFAALEQLEIVPVLDRFGKPIWRFEIWLGRGLPARGAIAACRMRKNPLRLWRIEPGTSMKSA